MTPTRTGMLVGAVLALTGIVLGFWAMILVAVAVVIGWAVGRVVEGELDLRSLGETLRGRRSS